MFDEPNGSHERQDKIPMGRPVGRALSFLRDLSVEELDQEIEDCKAELAGLTELRKAVAKFHGEPATGERKASRRGKPVGAGERLAKAEEMLSDGSEMLLSELATHCGYKAGKEGFLRRAVENDPRFDFDSTRNTVSLAR